MFVGDALFTATFFYKVAVMGLVSKGTPRGSARLRGILEPCIAVAMNRYGLTKGNPRLSLGCQNVVFVAAVGTTRLGQ